MLHGIVNVYKEAGFTSHDVVAKLRRITGQKKIGHTGTLDPEAVGVLPVCLGSATKLCGLLTEKKKTYRAVMLLGRITDTQDTSGQILEEREVSCTDEEIQAALTPFLGAGFQVPPMYSALKVGGKRLYELAREGKEVAREPRPVYFYELRFLKREGDCVWLETTCSKGTYIRTLCADIGEALGCGACMKELTRSQVDCFRLEDAKMLAELEELQEEGRLEEVLVPVDRFFSAYPAVQVKLEGERYLKNGNPLAEEMLEKFRLKNNQDFSEELECSNLKQSELESFHLEQSDFRHSTELEQPGLEQLKSEQPGDWKQTKEAEEGNLPNELALPANLVRVYDRDGCFQALYQRENGEEQAVYRPWKTFFQT